MLLMRAKMQVIQIDPTEEGETIHFHAVGKDDYDESGLDKSNTFAKFAPSAGMAVAITNPKLIGEFSVGQFVNLEFKSVD
jgi:hypothetical protein